jgi:two-component system, NarL family, nitrate/nitrite response regulator NarL
MNRPIRVVLADDHSLFRQGLRSLLRLQPDIEVLAEVDRVGEIPSVLADHPCDVLLLDLQMDCSALDDIKSLSHIARVVVVTASELVNEALAAVRLGARAVVQKRYAIETLVEAIRAVAEGLVWMPPNLQAAITSQWEPQDDKQLTAREREITRHVALGLRNGEVAKRLRISEGTVKTHMNNIFHKLAVRDRVELTLYALRTGLITVHDQAL